jgi:two-component system response regulator FixJ
MPSDKPFVHVIDDDEAVRDALAFQLGSAGIEVRTYESAVVFLEVAQELHLPRKLSIVHKRATVCR